MPHRPKEDFHHGLLASPQSSSLVFSVLGGVFASAAFELSLLAIDLVDHVRNRRTLISTFGKDVFSEDFTLAYASFRTSDQAQKVLSNASITMPHVAADETQHQFVFRVDEAVASHDLRALTHLATLLVRYGGKPAIKRAADLVQPFDLSFVAFGLAGSQKSRQLLNQLERFDIGLGIEPYLDLQRISTKTPLAQAKPGLCISYVIRLHPKQFPDRTWLLCAGTGPDGTIASAFYLARHFNRINKLPASDGRPLGSRQCVIVIRSEPQREESADADSPVCLDPSEE